MTLITSYEFSDEQNSHFLRQILQFITANKITPTPINYAISYEYVTGSNIGLTAAVDLLLKQKKTITSEASSRIYNKYICDISFESLDKINQGLASIINHTRDTAATTSQKASDAGDVFEDHAASIASVKNVAEFKKSLSEIVKETKGLAEISSALKTELDSANQEMNELRAELSKVRVSAATDALTGLLNRGAFDKALNNLIEQVDVSESCLTMLDLDHFKKVNDTHGHLIGDNVLKYTAKLIKKYTEPHHYVARYGGEELAIIMPDTSLNQAAEIAESIRDALASSRLKKKNSSETIGKITVSIGISTLKQEDTVEDLIMRADNALYSAKETGRNKVVTEKPHK